MDRNAGKNRPGTSRERAKEHGHDEQARPKQKNSAYPLNDVRSGEDETRDPHRVPTVKSLNAGLHVSAKRHLLYHAGGQSAHDKHGPARSGGWVGTQVRHRRHAAGRYPQQVQHAESCNESPNRHPAGVACVRRSARPESKALASLLAGPPRRPKTVEPHKEEREIEHRGDGRPREVGAHARVQSREQRPRHESSRANQQADKDRR